MNQKARIFALAIATLLLLVTVVSNLNLTFAMPMLPPMPDEPTLDPLSIPKFTDQLVIPPVYVPKNIYDSYGRLIRQEYTVTMSEFYQQILPAGYPMTLVWGYGGSAKDAVTGKYLGFVRNSPAPGFEAIRDIPVRVKWVNQLTRSIYAIDPTIHWADPNNMMMADMGDMNMTFEPFPPGYAEAQAPVPTCVHVHGAEVPSYYDGGPEQWFTANGLYGKDYASLYPTSIGAAIYEYPNKQLPTTMWYHDHALGITRINVFSGLAGFYILRDKNTIRDPVAPLLPKGKYEIPIAIQDRSFNQDGSLWFPSVGVNPTIHPYWQPEYFGNTIMVNGKLWPNLNVDQGQYRFRILDGSNARFYNLSLLVMAPNSTATYLPFTLIGAEGGYIRSAVNVTSISLAPGQRNDVLVNFKGLPAGTKILMTNDAAAPYPSGDPVDPDTTGQIMQFTVTTNSGKSATQLPSILNPTLNGAYPTLHAPDQTRTLPYFEQEGPDGPLGVFLNGQKWDGVLTEMPQVGSTEDWYLVNPTMDAHPIHTHLTTFQLVYRIPFNDTVYIDDWMALNGPIPLPLNQTPTELSVLPYLTGPPEYPTAEEMAWRETIMTPPGYVTVIRIRWAPQEAPVNGPNAPVPGRNLYSFDPSKGPGYVWHCHIVDHEDNEMMRRYKVISPAKTTLSVQVYDMDTAGEFRIYVNGKQVYSNPTDPTKNNIWTTKYFDITSKTIFGSNTIVLVNPTTATCKVRNVVVKVGNLTVINDTTTTTLHLSSKQYSFSV